MLHQLGIAVSISLALVAAEGSEVEAGNLTAEAEGLEVVVESLEVEAACRWPGVVLRQAYETH